MLPGVWITTHIFFTLLNHIFNAENFIADKDGIVILDVGSADVNGNMLDAIRTSAFSDRKYSYIGLDMDDTFNVNVVVSPDELPSAWPLKLNSIDIIISSSCLEHDDAFWDTFAHMSKLLKNGGIMFITVPSYGKIHRYPVDNWRFYPDAAYALAKYANRINLSGNITLDVANTISVLYSEVLYSESKWDDLYMIFRKHDDNRLNNQINEARSEVFRFLTGLVLKNLKNYIEYSISIGERYQNEVNEKLIQAYDEAYKHSNNMTLLQYYIPEMIFRDMNSKYISENQYCRYPYDPRVPSREGELQTVLFVPFEIDIDRCKTKFYITFMELELYENVTINRTITHVIEHFHYPSQVGISLYEYIITHLDELKNTFRSHTHMNGTVTYPYVIEMKLAVFYD